MSTTWWLRFPGGKRVRVTPAGVLFGRAPECDVVLDDARASRSQAIVFASAGALRLSVLGKGATTVNGEAVEHERDLVEGDTFALPGAAVEVSAERADAAPADAPVVWMLRSASSGVFGVPRTPFTIGGGPADLCIEGWPAQVMRFHVGARLEVEALELIAIDGVYASPGELEALRPGTVVEYRGERITVIAGGDARDVSTLSEAGGIDDDVRRVRVDFLPKGGRLTVHRPGGDVAVYLSDRRCDLVAALLQPPEPYVPGDLVPDDALLPRVWPGQPKTRVDLNVLIHRTRRDLSRAGLDGAALLQRAPGGSATRFAIPRTCEVLLA